MPTTCGTVKVGGWPAASVGEDSAVDVEFGFTFDVPPAVVVLIAAIDAKSPLNKRISVWASDVTQVGFRLHARTWADSITWSVKASWVASSDFSSVQLGSQAVGCLPDRCVSAKAASTWVDFPHGSFPCLPDVGAGLSLIDAEGGEEFGLQAESAEVNCRGFSLSCDTLGLCRAWGAKASWIASASPCNMQLGWVELGGAGDEIHGGSEHAKHVDVLFPRSFGDKPDVAIALSGIVADHRKVALRIDVWAEDVGQKGFRLHVKSWENSVTERVRFLWIATPAHTSAGIKVRELRPHQPPSDYVVEGPMLGQGWWGVTHRARHIGDGKVYAVKTCKHSFSQHEEYLRRELETLTRLPVHPSLLRYHACVLQSDQLHIVTEYLDAYTFADLLPGLDGAFPHKHSTSTVLRWMAQLLDGLAQLHKVGIVHRDLHGENVLVEKDSNGSPSQGTHAVRIIDFGVAKVYAVLQPQPMSNPAGCWQYFSPERRRGEDFDDRDDVWAVGCHLTELTTGSSIKRRKGCGCDGVDFATSSAHIADAIRECGNNRCRQLAEAVLVMEHSRRPSAASARDLIQGQLLNVTLGKRSSDIFRDGDGFGAGPSGGRRCRLGRLSSSGAS